jgi:hypothetical protein
MRQDVALMSHLRLAGLACLVFLSAVSAVAAEKWVEVRSPNFRVISDGSEKDARHVAHEFEPPAAESSYAGRLAEVELRDELPTPSVNAAGVTALEKH